MLCPQCQQGVQGAELRDGACPYCGFPCATLERRVRVIQVMISAFFASTLVYGALAGFLELVVGYQAPGVAGLSEGTLGLILLGSSVAILLVSVNLEGRALRADSVPGYVRTVMLLAAMAEIPAICGIVMYLVTGSLPWMVGFLAASWALLIRLGLHLPRILQGMADCLRR